MNCGICGARLGEDGTCPSCSSQLEMEQVIGEHELRALGWSSGEYSGFDEHAPTFSTDETIGTPVKARSGRATAPAPAAHGNGVLTYVALDLEIARIIPDSARSWDMYRPFGITCAATVQSDGSSRIWHGVTAGGGLADRMTRDEVVQFVEYLENEASSGKTLLTWNGAGFDFSVLAEESGLRSVCQELAYQHVDMMFHFFCVTGFALGLDKAARGLGLPGKLAGMTGADAPR